MSLFEVATEPVAPSRREVLAVGSWPTNAELIADVAQLGYLDGRVLDATYGEGKFWTAHRPEGLTTNDRYKDADLHFDYCAAPFADRTFDSVVFDPPYRLSGRRDRGNFDFRFGLMEYRSNDEILDDIVAGARECYRVTARYLLVKCQDQVNGGRVRWQTDMVTDCVTGMGARKVDRFDFVMPSLRPQPAHRRQLTARRNHSTLLIFRRPQGTAAPSNLLDTGTRGER